MWKWVYDTHVSEIESDETVGNWWSCCCGDCCCACPSAEAFAAGPAMTGMAPTHVVFKQDPGGGGCDVNGNCGSGGQFTGPGGGPGGQGCVPGVGCGTGGQFWGPGGVLGGNGCLPGVGCGSGHG